MFFSTQQNHIWLGCMLSGLGFSLVVPSLGIEALKRVPLQNRGAAIGAFLAFFDLSFCIAIPIAGAVANKSTYQIVYLIGAVAALLGACVAWRLFPNQSKDEVCKLKLEYEITELKIGGG